MVYVYVLSNGDDLGACFKVKPGDDMCLPVKTIPHEILTLVDVCTL